jgi:hypothetical protein
MYQFTSLPVYQFTNLPVYQSTNSPIDFGGDIRVYEHVHQLHLTPFILSEVEVNT